MLRSSRRGLTVIEMALFLVITGLLTLVALNAYRAWTRPASTSASAPPTRAWTPDSTPVAYVYSARASATNGAALRVDGGVVRAVL